ncbi:MAG: DUF3737 family protein [Coriobacteriales bacterium]|nr:DUF3737 family protein [Coriobacteriales bacterium]
MTNATSIISDRTFDGERALYGLSHATLERVRFAGHADGESALKECADITVSDATFELRYPLWHTTDVELTNALFTESCRAALWYASDVRIRYAKLLGIKAMRECDNVSIDASEIRSEEFGWSSRDVAVRDSSVEGEYAFLHARDLYLEDVRFRGKYSFQYVENLTIEGGTFDTKDAFWHARNVTVRDATLKGEYLGWYSEGLTLVNCRIEGTQPLVYCRDLTLVDCEMVGCDLAFEGSDVQVTIRGHVDSIRDPRSGRIEAGSVGEVVHDTLAGCGAQIVAGTKGEMGAHTPCTRIAIPVSRARRSHSHAKPTGCAVFRIRNKPVHCHKMEVRIERLGEDSYATKGDRRRRASALRRQKEAARGRRPGAGCKHRCGASCLLRQNTGR